MDTRGSDTDNNDTNSTTTNEGGHSAFAAPTATPPGDGPTAPVLPIQEEEHEGVEEHEEGVHEEDDGQRKEVDISLTDSQMLTIASAAAQNTMQTRCKWWWGVGGGCLLVGGVFWWGVYFGGVVWRWL